MKILVLIAMVFCVFLGFGTPASFAARQLHATAKATDNNNYSYPIDYVRTNIVLLRKSMPERPVPEPAPKPMPWEDESSIKQPPEETPLENPEIVLDVEIRDGMSLYNQSGWYNLSSYSEKQGVMMAFTKPGITPIVRSTQYAPVDILFIDKQGVVTQIAPNILLSDLEDDIYPSAPILAFLFLKGGTCADLHINVGDEVQYSLFKKPPLILNAPPAKEPQNSKPPPVTIEKF